MKARPAGVSARLPARGRLAAAVLLAGLGPTRAWCAAGAGETPGAPEALSPAQRKDLADLQRQWAYKPALSDDWYAAAEEILKFGQAGRKALLTTVEIKLRGLHREYRGAFQLQARRLRAEQTAEAARQGKGTRQLEQEARQARQAVLSLLRKEDLDKKDLVEKADPAMKTLEELLCVAPAAVTASSKELPAQREQLRRLWALRQRCAGEGESDVEKSLEAMEELACLLAMPVTAGVRGLLEANAKAGEKIRWEEAQGIRDLNRIRLLLGLSPLWTDVRLCQAARDHSADMRTKGFFSHDSPVSGKETPWKRAKLAGTSASAENIADGAADGRGANRQWFHSPGHFKNMLGNHKRVGLGHDGKWTQMFGR